VISAGSRIGERAYTARDEHTPAPLPRWIADLLQDEPTGLPASIQRGPRGTAYAMAALCDKTRLVATARPGTRNNTLNRAAFSLGQLAASGLIPPLAVVTALASAAERAGLPTDEARRIIRSGMSGGAAASFSCLPAPACRGHSWSFPLRACSYAARDRMPSAGWRRTVL